MILLGLLPIETIPASDLEVVAQAALACFPCAVRYLEALPLPPDAYDPARDQYHASTILRAALDASPPDATRLLAVTSCDLFIPMLTFVFGQAQVDGTAAVISLARLHQEFHGLPPRPNLLRDRISKETVHELGHTFGLYHCPDSRCAMALSINIADVDAKRSDLCHDCAVRLADRIADLPQAARGNKE